MRRPLLALFGALGLGIWVGASGVVPQWIAWSLCALAVLSALLLRLVGRAGPLRFLVWLVAVWSLGCLRAWPMDLPEQGLPSGQVVAQARAEGGYRYLGQRRLLPVRIQGLHLSDGQTLALDGSALLTILLDEDGGQSCPAVLPGDRLRIMLSLRYPVERNNPGQAGVAQLQRMRRIKYRGLVRSCSQILIEAEGRQAGWEQLAERSRLAIRSAIAGRGGEGGPAAVLTALTIGDGGMVPDEVRQDFQRSGLAHLLAVSGLHLGIVALGAYLLLCWIGVRIQRLAIRFDVPRLAAITVIPLTLFYTALAGGRLPTIRACVVVVCFLLAVVIRRRADPLQTLAAAGLLVLGLWPGSLFEVSFQLSFVATGSVILFTPRLCSLCRVPLAGTQPSYGLVRRLGTRLAQLGLVSLAATLGTAPVTALYFNQTSLAGLVANLLAVPLAAWLIVPLGLLGAVTLIISGTLSGWIFDGALSLCQYLNSLADWFAQIPLGSVQVGSPSGIQLVAWYGGLLCLLYWARGRWVRWTALGALVVFVGAWGVGRIAPLLSDELQVTLLDVGQGESILIRFPGGGNMLVDGGGARAGGFDTGKQVIAPFLRSQGINHLDAVVATHRHPDHIGGLISVLMLFEPEVIWSPAPLHESENSQALARAAGAVGAVPKVIQAGQVLWERDGVRLEALWPQSDSGELSENENSLVLMLRYGSRAILLTGDLERSGEQALLARRGPALKADVLKVGHHGSRHASSKAWLEAVGPSHALISVGAYNSYGLPHPDTLGRLAESDVQVWRTDRQGAITVVTDGQELWLSSEVESQNRPIRPTDAPVAPRAPSGE